jgi:demethylmenaquinone methyltransferase/2-methoxy-6-polyprenyl-1,4-benzoquinol methylase/phosphoethanolamine N-methyltransferase
MVEVARGKARRRHNAARFQVAAVERMPFPDASFDVVLSSLMMHQLPGDLRQRALAEIKRVLRPGGRVLLVDFQHTAQLPRPWEPGWLLSRRHKLHGHAGMQFRPAGAGLGDLLHEAGYEGVESGPTRYGWIVYARGRVPA